MKFKFRLAMMAMLFTLTARAGTLPSDHFLYPADEEVAFLAGAISNISLNFARKLLVRCADGTVDPKYTDHCRAADRLREGSAPAEEFPWDKMTAQVLYFGEMHLGQESKIFLAAHMHDLKNRGYGALGMEMFNSKTQPELDRYFRGELTLQQIEAVLRSGWNYESSGYLNVIAAAKAEGLRILALDDRDTPWTDWFQSLLERDRHMAGVLAAAIGEQPDLKIAVLCGRMHAFGVYSQQSLVLSQPARVRETYGLTTQSVLVYSALEPGDAGYNVMQKAIFGVDRQTLMIPPAGYGYGDVFLFLRDPRTPALPAMLNPGPWREEYLRHID